MILESFIKGFVGLIFLLTLKMGPKRRKVENHWPRRVYKRRFAGIRPFSIGSDGKKVGVNLR